MLPLRVMIAMAAHHVMGVFFLGLILVKLYSCYHLLGILAHLMHQVDSQRYTALYTHEATVNQSMFDDLVKQAGDQGKDLVHLNTTCASSNSTIHNM